MSDVTHTPAPWHIQSPDTGAVYGSAGRIVASVYGDDPECHRDARLDANARLIAAAPDMLEALRKAEEGLRSCYQVCDYPANGHSTQDYALRDVCDAIAKATGEQP